MKKHDLILIAALFAVALVSFAAFYGFNMRQQRNVLRVTAQDGTIYTLRLDQDISQTIVSAWGHNIVVVKEGKAFVESSDCKNQICVNSRSISVTGETIACLPHQLILEIVQDN